jgi:competence protein ComEA
VIVEGDVVKNNRGLLAGIVALAMLLVVGYSVQRGRAAEDQLVITGRGYAPAPDPKTLLPSQNNSTQSSTSSNPQPQPTNEVVVYVTGAVIRPGVYHLPITARIEDAVKASGGAKPEADLEAVNLAAHLEDGMQLHIPRHSQAASASLPPPTSIPTYSVGSKPSGTTHTRKLNYPGQGTININTASEEELQHLPGIGPSYAAKIVQLRRQFGFFTNADQLKDIPGISATRFAKIRAFIRIQ